MNESKRQAGEKSGLVRGLGGKLAHLLGNDIDALLSDLSAGSIGGIKLDDSTVQTIISNGASMALETAIRSNAAMREIELRSRLRNELEEQRHQNRMQHSYNRAGMSESGTGSDYMSTSELMAREGTQEEARSCLEPPAANPTLGEWYETLGAKQRRLVLSWFDSEIDFNSASEMDARYVFDNMSH